MQWTIDTYKILTHSFTSHTQLETVQGFRHMTTVWGIHAVNDRYHLTHIPSGRRLSHSPSLVALNTLVTSLLELPVMWDTPTPVFTIATERSIALLLDS